MNLIDGTVEGGAFKAAGMNVAGVMASMGLLRLASGRKTQLLSTAVARSLAPSIPWSLATTMVSIRIGDALVSVKASKDYRNEINEVSFSVPAPICHLFDAKAPVSRLGPKRVAAVCGLARRTA